MFHSLGPSWAPPRAVLSDSVASMIWGVRVYCCLGCCKGGCLVPVDHMFMSSASVVTQCNVMLDAAGAIALQKSSTLVSIIGNAVEVFNRCFGPMRISQGVSFSLFNGCSVMTLNFPWRFGTSRFSCQVKEVLVTLTISCGAFGEYFNEFSVIS